jgi:peptide-methionine (S)-S-oxide reductase
MEKATFAAGCFWHVEAAFRKVKGVVGTRVGYTGGEFNSPSYEDVCTGRTGHAESVEVDFDPSQISYSALLDVFWSVHDPTTPDRQGPDVGSQYRSAVFYHTQAQRDEAIASTRRLEESSRLGGRKVVTQIVPASMFYPAEEYHQRYLEKRGQTSCRLC